MRGPLKAGVFGDGSGAESKRERRSGHRFRFRSDEGKPQLFKHGANGMGGCPSQETGTAGQHATIPRRIGSRLFFGNVTFEIQGHGGTHSTDTDASRVVRNTPKSSQPRGERLWQGDLVEIALERFREKVL